MAQASAAAPTSAADLVAQLHEVDLLDQRGQRFHARSLLGQVTLVQFMHTRCSQGCRAQTQSLVGLRRQLPPALRTKLRFLSVSLDPAHDTPATLRAYARKHGADVAGWHWVTGPVNGVAALASRLVLFPPKPQAGQAAAQARLSAFRQAQVPSPVTASGTAGAPSLDSHDKALWLLDGQGVVRQRYAADPVDTDRLQVDLTSLVRLGSAARRVG